MHQPRHNIGLQCQQEIIGKHLVVASSGSLHRDGVDAEELGRMGLASVLLADVGLERAVGRPLEQGFVAIMSETGEVIFEIDNSNYEGNLDAFDNPHEESTILHTKKFCIGSGNIIGKGVIQDLFTCAGALPTLGGSIHQKTSSLADAISFLVFELERQFVHMHPSIQRIFLEFSNIEHSFVKRAATFSSST